MIKNVNLSDDESAIISEYRQAVKEETSAYVSEREALRLIIIKAGENIKKSEDLNLRATCKAVEKENNHEVILRKENNLEIPDEREAEKELYIEHLNQEENDDLVEQIASEMHKIWMEWSKKIADEEILSSARMQRWMRSWVDYGELKYDLKEMDRELAKRVLKVVSENL